MSSAKLNLEVLERIAKRGSTITPSDTLALIARIRDLERELTIAKGNNAARLDGLSDAIATLERAQQRAVPAGWQPIETAPHHESILIAGPYGMAVVYKDSYGEWCPDGVGVNYDMASTILEIGKPTHWMPLRAAPATQHTENSNG